MKPVKRHSHVNKSYDHFLQPEGLMCAASYFSFNSERVNALVRPLGISRALYIKTNTWSNPVYCQIQPSPGDRYSHKLFS